MEAQKNGLIFVAPLPPDYHGQSISSSSLLARMIDEGLSVEAINVGRNSHDRFPNLSRMLRLVRSNLKILLANKGSVVYLSLNANKGMLFTLFSVCCARLKGLIVVIHHHTYSHISSRSWVMARLVRIAKKTTTHFSICDVMAEELKQSYQIEGDSLALSNVGIIDQSLTDIDIDDKPPRTVGYLSNITVEKGISEVVDCFRHLLGRDLVDDLVVAGPLMDSQSKEIVASAELEFGSSFKYLGALAGEEKKAFFSSIDLFIFPSLYRNETQGMVNLEALAAGVPVVAYAQCCIASDLQGEGCLAVTSDKEFSIEVDVFLPHYNNRVRETKCSARKRYHYLMDAAEEQFARLLECCR